MKKDIIKVLNTEMLDFMAPVLINNLPSIDGLLVSQRQVIWGMDKAHMNSNGQFYKMLKASGRIFDYYVLGDMPLCGVMKNMANNYILNKYLMSKGSFGNKNFRNSKGSAPRYIECKLSKYGEYMLEGIKEHAVNMKDNYDATEKEPIIMPSKVPNILTNLRMSIAVSEANKMPSHNMKDTCESIISYIRTSDIDKSIEILKAPDLPSGGRIIYNKDTFNKIYKTGRGSFSIIGKYKYDEKKNTMTIYEIPYTTYAENIEDEIENNINKFQNVLSDHPHQGSDKDGLKIVLYLKKGINPNTVETLLRKYTSYEDKFPCNFTILDLDGKTPKLMSLEDIITKWIYHRQTCIKNELSYKINQQEVLLNKYKGLKIIDKDIEKAIDLIRNTKQKELIDTLINEFNLNNEQAEYIKTILLTNINKDWLKEKFDKIPEIENYIKDLTNKKNDVNYLNEVIIKQLNECISKFGQNRKTDIIYNDKFNSENNQEDIIEQYNCRIYYTNHYIKKYSKQSDNHKYKDSDIILGDIATTNKSTLLIFTNQGNRYKIPVHELSKYTPSQLGDYIYNVTTMSKDEEIIRIVSIDKEIGFMYFVYSNGKIAKVDIKSFLGNYKKLQKCYNANSKLLDCYYSEKDIDIALFSSEGKGLIINTSNINSKSSRTTQGITAQKLPEGIECIGCVIDVQKEDHILLITEKSKNKEFILDDIAPTNKSNEERTLYQYISGRCGNGGNFLINTRSNNDKLTSAKIIKTF